MPVTSKLSDVGTDERERRRALEVANQGDGLIYVLAAIGSASALACAPLIIALLGGKP